MNIFDGKAEFSAAIAPVFNWFGAQETFYIISVSSIFVETIMHFFRILW